MTSGALVLFGLWAVLQVVMFGTIREPAVGVVVVAGLLAIWLVLQVVVSLALRLLRR